VCGGLGDGLRLFFASPCQKQHPFTGRRGIGDGNGLVGWLGLPNGIVY